MTTLPSSPVLDVHVFLRRGEEILLSRRAGAYGHGRWHAPSGKLEPGEPLTSGAAREVVEETGVIVDPAHLRLVHVVHHRQSESVERIGFFFEAVRWQGEPVNREPAKCLELRWFHRHALPADIIEYPAAGLYGYLDGQAPLTEHGWPQALVHTSDPTDGPLVLPAR